MKILFIADTYPPNVNGAALATEQLVRRLAQAGHSITVIAPSPSFRAQRETDGAVTIYRVKSVPILIEKVQKFRISPQPLHAKQIRKIVTEVKPDVIHIVEPWWLGLSGIRIARKKGIPVVLSHHFMPENLVHYLHLPLQMQRMIERTIWKWYKNFCRNADCIVCPTQKAADLLSKQDASLPLRVISNGIDLQKFSSSNDGSYLKQKYHLPDTVTFLFVGRLDKEKNIDVLVQALGLIKSESSKDFHAIIAGQGKEETPLKELAAELGILQKIIVTGYLAEEDLPNIYTVGDIFVMPSIAELQSLVTMEAMASGLPVVGADAVALPHLIHDGENGFLFQPGNARELADALSKLLSDASLRKKMGESSLKIIQAHDVRQVVQEMEEVYQQVIKLYEQSSVTRLLP